MRLILTDPGDLATAVADLRALSSSARRLLARCIEAQGVGRTKLSSSAIALEDAGFIRVREEGWGCGQSFMLLPTVAGEEAMEALDEGGNEPL